MNHLRTDHEALSRRRASSLTLALFAAALSLALARAALAGAPPLSFAVSAYADAKDRPLRSPRGVGCDDQGAVLVADTGNGRLVRYEWLGGVLKGGLEVKLPQLTVPTRVQLEAGGTALVLDQKTRKVVRVGAKGEFLGVLDGAETPEPALFPVAFKATKGGGAALLDVAAGRVVVLDAAGKFVSQTELPKGLSPADVAVDASGALYLIDAVTGQLYKSAQAAGAAPAFAPLGKPLKEYLSFPGYLTVTDKGGIVVVDRHGNGLVRANASGEYQGRQLSMGWADGLVYYPAEICIDAKGTTFVADRNNHRLQIFTQAE